MDNASIALTVSEETKLREYEIAIERGVRTFVEVGCALAAIRDERLYRAEHGTFEEYCRERWGIERRQAYRLIDAAATVTNVSLGTQTEPPQHERQARPLTRLEPAEQIAAWQEAVDTAPNGKVTALIAELDAHIVAATSTGAPPLVTRKQVYELRQAVERAAA